MQKRNFDPSNTIILNATCIGKKYSGLGLYALKLVGELTSRKLNINFHLVLNKSAKCHFRNFQFPENFKVKWSTSLISPDYNFFGHLLRLLYSNFLSVLYFRYVQFNASQLEINFFKRKQVVTVHDIIPLIFKKYHKKQSLYYQFILKLGLKSAQSIIAPSFHSRDMILNTYNISADKMKVIYHGVENKVNSDTNFNDMPETKYLLYIGRICKMKNIQRLLQAYHSIKDRIEHKLVIVGDDAELLAKEINTISNDGDFRNRIIFLSNISEENKNNLLRNADALLFPSLYEGFGLPALEAMANGCPVITSSNSSLPEVCKDAAVYVNPFDTIQIAETIYNLLNNETLRTSLRKKGFSRAQLFSWEHSINSHVFLFNKVLARMVFSSSPVHAKVLASSEL